MAEITSTVGDVLTSSTIETTQVQGNRVTITQTTTVDKDGGTYLTDVNYIPKMRGVELQFIAYNMRPNREVFYYFDEVPMNHFIQRPNIIELDTRNAIRGFGSVNGREEIRIAGAAKAICMLNEQALDSGNSRIYVMHFENGVATPNVGDQIIGLSSGIIGNVVSYIHQSGVVRTGSNTTSIVLDGTAEDTTNDYYVGNVITLMNGHSSNIVGYTASTRRATISPAVGEVPANTIYSIGDPRSQYVSNTTQAHYTTERGFITGTLWIPDPSQNSTVQFFTGDRIFRILDNAQNDNNDYSTRAEYRFTTNGLEVETQQIINRTVSTNVAVTQINVVPPPPPPPPPTPRQTGGSCFVAGSLVTMSDGTKKCIEDVKIGDVLKGQTGFNTVLDFDHQMLDNGRRERELYSINGCVPFVTAEHPLMTREGWKSAVPSETERLENSIYHLIVGALEVGDEIELDNGEWLAIESIEKHDDQPQQQVYNFILDGDHTYYVNDMLAHNKSDPTAQQFFVSSSQHPEGIFLTSVDLYFKNRSELLPIEVQIRPMVNGVPDSYNVLPGASCILQPDQIKVSDFPDSSNSATYTRFSFPSPVYLAPGLDYAFVVLTNSYEYDFFVAETSQKILGSDRIVSKQPYAGSMFKSQNALTYTPIQAETVMFRLNKARFVSSGQVTFSEKKQAVYDGSGNTLYDLFVVHSDAAELPETTIDYAYKATTSSNNILETAFSGFRPEYDVLLTERKNLYSPAIPDRSFYMQVDMSTDNTDVSPFMWRNRQSLVTVENVINNMPINNSDISIASTGTGYANGTTSLSFVGPTGLGANGRAICNATGSIISVEMDSVGAGYYDNVSCIVTGAGSGADILVNTETGKSGGNALVRQYSKPVTLTTGASAGDLRTYLTVSKPLTANVNVYYRVKNPLDPDDIEDKNWVKMMQETSIYVYSKNLEKVEYAFKPSFTSNNISYSTDTTTYNTFNQYQIKIVMNSSGTGARDIPYVHDARTIALPADEF